MEAFELVNCIFYEIGNRDIDDSDGGTSFVADNCYEYWQTILQECNDKENSYHIYPLRIKDFTEEQRDRMNDEIAKSEVAVNVHFIPMPMLSFFNV